MTKEEVLLAAMLFVSDNELEVGPLQAVRFFPEARDEDLVDPAHWGVYFQDTTPVDDRLELGDRPTIIEVDEATGRVKLFWYL